MLNPFITNISHSFFSLQKISKKDEQSPTSSHIVMSQVAFPSSKTIHPNENNGLLLEDKGEISYLRTLGHQERASLVDALGISEVAGLGVSGAVRQWEGWPRKGRGKILKTHLSELYELLMDNFFIWPGIQCHAMLSFTSP